MTGKPLRCQLRSDQPLVRSRMGKSFMSDRRSLDAGQSRYPSARATLQWNRRGQRRAGWNSSTRLPDGSTNRICDPPGPVTISLRNCAPASRNRATSAGRSSTMRWMRFQPPGFGRSPSGIGRPAELAGPLSRSLSDARWTSAKAGAWLESTCRHSGRVHRAVEQRYVVGRLRYLHPYTALRRRSWCARHWRRTPSGRRFSSRCAARRRLCQEIRPFRACAGLPRAACRPRPFASARCDARRDPRSRSASCRRSP